MSDWKQAQISGGKLFKVHNFTYMFKGSTYSLEIDEFADGSFTGHGEHAADKSSVLESVTADSLVSCLNSLIANIESR